MPQAPVSRLSLNMQRILALSSVKGLGVIAFNKLRDHFGSVEGIWQASYEDFIALKMNPSLSRAVCDVRESFESSGDLPVKQRIESWLGGERRYLLSIDDEQYPDILKEIHGAPPYLYVEGCLDAFSATSIGVVGSRNATIAGKQHAQLFAKELALNHMAITSGLALGIDGAAHQGALEADGITLAVLATGLDVIYPKKHLKLAEQIKERGALVSEMALGTMPLPANFPRRNRVISGLSEGVLVIEASLKSGSLITADYAAEQNREVFALPGALSSPSSKGCHHLIKQGASLVESAQDVLDGLSMFNRLSKPEPNYVAPKNLSDDEMSVIKALGHEQVAFDNLIASTQFPVHLLTQLLMTMELKGLVASVPGGYQRV